MLHSGFNEFNWSVVGTGSTDFLLGPSVSYTTGASNTKGSAVEVVAGTAVTEDIYELHVLLVRGTTAGAFRSSISDILVDPDGGSSWITLIPNLLAHQTDITQGGCCYKFPIFIKAGSSIGIKGQANTATQTLTVSLKGFGKPTRPDLIKVGSKVEALGVDLVNTIGTAITPGSTGSWGSYATIGTTSNENFFWQAGVCCTDTTMAMLSNYFSFYGGDATNKLPILSDLLINATSGEILGHAAQGTTEPFRLVPAGTSIYARASCYGTPDSGMTTTVYGVS